MTNNEPKVIHSGHYHVSTPTDFRRNSNSKLNGSSSNMHTRTPDQSQYNRYSANYSSTQDPMLSSRQSINNDQSQQHRGSNNKMSSGNSSQTALQQEETFGVFASDEDPKLYQRR